ncbi:hypothetical protein JCM5296_003149 [Sporobolomyces johnsonii]
MASRTASPAHPPSTPAAAARNKPSSLKPSSTSSPRPASPAAASATAPASPAPPAAAAAAPLPDLSTLLNLPLRLVVAASGDLPQREIEGSLFTYDPSTSYVVLSRPSSSSSSPAAHPTTSKRAYHLIKTSQIKSVAVLSLTPDSSLPSPSTPLPSGVSPSPADLAARVDRAVADDQKARARLGGPGVSDEAQALFDLLGRTLPVRWAATSIVVMDEVVIESPYQAENVKGAKGSVERVERVRKVLEGIRQRLGNGTATPVLG